MLKQLETKSLQIIKVETEKSQPQKPNNQNPAKIEKSPLITTAVKASESRTQPKDKANNEELPPAWPCPECGENLEFMGWSEDELKEKQTCPFCGKEILFNK